MLFFYGARVLETQVTLKKIYETQVCETWVIRQTWVSQIQILKKW